MWVAKSRIGFGLVPAFAAAALLSNTLALGGPVAYDGFEAGPVADIHGYNGGQGWTGPWSDVGAGILTEVMQPIDGLTFGDLDVTAGYAHTPGGWLPDMTSYQRLFPAITGNAMYLSFLIRPTPDYSNWYTLRLGNYPSQIDVGLPIGSYNYGLMFGDGLIDVGPTEAQPGVTVFLVLEMLRNTASNSTTYTLFVNPTPGAPRPTTGSVQIVRGGLVPLSNSLQLLGEGGYDIDEIRIGQTWGSVTPLAALACRPDLNGDGVLDFFDALAFIGAFANRDAIADWNFDQMFDFFDVQGFLADFSGGCP